MQFLKHWDSTVFCVLPIIVDLPEHIRLDPPPADPQAVFVQAALKVYALGVVQLDTNMTKFEKAAKVAAMRDVLKPGLQPFLSRWAGSNLYHGVGCGWLMFEHYKKN